MSKKIKDLTNVRINVKNIDMLNTSNKPKDKILSKIPDMIKGKATRKVVSNTSGKLIDNKVGKSKVNIKGNTNDTKSKINMTPGKVQGKLIGKTPGKVLSNMPGKVKSNIKDIIGKVQDKVSMTSSTTISKTLGNISSTTRGKTTSNIIDKTIGTTSDKTTSNIIDKTIGTTSDKTIVKDINKSKEIAFDKVVVDLLSDTEVDDLIAKYDNELTLEFYKRFEARVPANRRNEVQFLQEFTEMMMSCEIDMSQETIDAHITVRRFILSIKYFGDLPSVEKKDMEAGITCCTLVLGLYYYTRTTFQHIAKRPLYLSFILNIYNEAALSLANMINKYKPLPVLLDIIDSFDYFEDNFFYIKGTTEETITLFQEILSSFHYNIERILKHKNYMMVV